MQEERVDGIVDPGKLQPLLRQRACVDLGSRRVGLQHAARDPPGDPLAGELRPKQAEIHRYQVLWTAIEGNAVAPVRPQGTPQLGLEIAGEEALDLRVVARLIGCEARFEKAARLVGALQPRSLGADAAPIAHATAQRCDIERLVVGAFLRAPRTSATTHATPRSGRRPPNPAGPEMRRAAAPADPVRLVQVGVRSPA